MPSRHSLLTFFTFWPLVWILAVPLAALAMVKSGGPFTHGVAPFAIFMVLHFATIFMGLGTWIYYLIDASKHAPLAERTTWLVLLFVFSALAAPVYYLRHVRGRGLAPVTEGPAPALSAPEKSVALAMTLVPSAWFLSFPFAMIGLRMASDGQAVSAASIAFAFLSTVSLIIGLTTWVAYLADVPRRVPAEKRASWYAALAFVPPIATLVYFRRFLAPPAFSPLVDQR